MKCALEVSPGGTDPRWTRILAEAGIKDITIDLNAFDPFSAVPPPEPDIKGAVPGYRLRQKAYRKTEKFFNLCAQYGIRTALKKAGKSILKTGGTKTGLSDSPLAASVGKIANAYAEKGFQVAYVQAPALPLDRLDINVTDHLLKLAKESINICANAGCSALVFQPLAAGIPKDDEWQANRRFFLEILPLARQHNVNILLENQARMFNGRIVRGTLSDPIEAVKWVDALNGEAGGEIFGMCLNVETCNQCRQNIREYIQRLGSRLKAVRAIFRLSARFDYREIILSLRRIRFDGILALDARWLFHGLPDSMQEAILTIIAQTLVYLRMQAELEMKLRKYPEFVLFGAGLMFQNFMRNYGNIYPPVFACDNSPEKWGMEIDGIKVFPPQKLKDLPENFAVFICNRFYEEAEKQLEELGIRHIERFNDEMLPY